MPFIIIDKDDMEHIGKICKNSHLLSLHKASVTYTCLLKAGIEAIEKGTQNIDKIAIDYLESLVGKH